MRNYCTTDRDILQCSIKTLCASINKKSFSDIPTYIQSALVSLEKTKANDTKTVNILEAANGIVALFKRKYNTAVEHFLQVTTEIGTDFNDVMSSEDVAIYCGMAALATLPRQRLKQEVLGGTAFSLLLDTTPLIRSLISSFLFLNYSCFFSSLEMLKQRIKIDPFIGYLSDNLLTLIQDRALLQYIHPFSALNLQLMAKKFKLPIEKLEHELVEHILDGSIVGKKIDKQSGYLISVESSPVETALENALSVSCRFEFAAHNAVISCNLLRKMNTMLQKRENFLSRRDNAQYSVNTLLSDDLECEENMESDYENMEIDVAMHQSIYKPSSPRRLHNGKRSA